MPKKQTKQNKNQKFSTSDSFLRDHITLCANQPISGIRNINVIRKVLYDDTAATIVHALVTPRLNNGNSLSYGITERQL